MSLVPTVFVKSGTSYRSTTNHWYSTLVLFYIKYYSNRSTVVNSQPGRAALLVINHSLVRDIVCALWPGAIIIFFLFCFFPNVTLNCHPVLHGRSETSTLVDGLLSFFVDAVSKNNLYHKTNNSLQESGQDGECQPRLAENHSIYPKKTHHIRVN